MDITFLPIFTVSSSSASKYTTLFLSFAFASSQAAEASPSLSAKVVSRPSLSSEIPIQGEILKVRPGAAFKFEIKTLCRFFNT